MHMSFDASLEKTSVNAMEITHHERKIREITKFWNARCQLFTSETFWAAILSRRMEYQNTCVNGVMKWDFKVIPLNLGASLIQD